MLDAARWAAWAQPHSYPRARCLALCATLNSAPPPPWPLQAEAAVAARQQSHATQKSLKDRVALMEERALAAALAAQLRQSGTFDESDLPATNGNGNGSAAHHAAKGNGAGSDGVRHEAGGAHGHAAHVEAGVAAEAGGVVFTF